MTANVCVPVTLQRGCLSLQRSAGDGFLQSIDMYLICSSHLQHSDRQLIFNHWLTMNPCKYWERNSRYHEPWYDNTRGVRSDVHLFGGAVDVLRVDDHAVAWQEGIGASPWHGEGGRTHIGDQQAGRSRDHWDGKCTFRIGVRGRIIWIVNVLNLVYVSLPVAWVPTKGVLGLLPWRAMTLTVYSVPGRRFLRTTVSWSPLGAGSSSLSRSSELEYMTRYDVTVPSGLSQVMRMEFESMSVKVRSLGRSIAAGWGEEKGDFLSALSCCLKEYTLGITWYLKTA